MPVALAIGEQSEVLLSHVPTPWTRLASRCVRSMVLRQGMTVDDLLVAFETLGIMHSRRSHEGRLDRGTFDCAYFLQVMVASRSTFPPYWAPALLNADPDVCDASSFDWDAACVEIFTLECQAALYRAKLELANDPLERREVINRLLNEVKGARGRVPFTLLMYLAMFAPMIGFDCYLSLRDVMLAERELSLCPSSAPSREMTDERRMSASVGRPIGLAPRNGGSGQ
ncbi:DUF6471 domain-containing protein [Pandoraea aquatica]|uniref:DUF6471 domain-containing protein n=1 Tax=Pandoraea aquatica TaxID=2508290 RepID=UPI003CCD11DB